MVLVRSENGQLLMIPQQALAQMQAQAHAQAQPQTTMAPRPATPTSAPPVQISTVQVSTRPACGGSQGWDGSAALGGTRVSNLHPSAAHPLWQPPFCASISSSAKCRSCHPVGP